MTRYPEPLEDALRTAWTSTNDFLFWSTTHGQWCLRFEGFFGLLGGEPLDPAWTINARTAVDALPEYQAWREGLEK